MAGTGQAVSQDTATMHVPKQYPTQSARTNALPQDRNTVKSEQLATQCQHNTLLRRRQQPPSPSAGAGLFLDMITGRMPPDQA